MRKIETKKAPGAIGPYSQAFETNGFVITSGQIPVDPQTGLVPDGIEKTGPSELQKRGSHFGSGWHEPGKSRQDHLLFGGYEGFCRL